MKHNQKERRLSALVRLEAQLESGVKNTTEGETPLSEKDIKRINKEINILKERV